MRRAVKILAVALSWPRFAPPLLLAFTLGCSQHAQADDPVVAKSDTMSLRASEVQGFLQTLDSAAQQRVHKDPQFLLGLLKQEIARRALLQQAQAQKWEQRPEVAALIERTRTEVVLDSYLKSVSAPAASFPSEAELQQAYKLNQQRFLMPRTYRLAQIFVAVPADAAGAASAEARARRLLAQVRASPERFGEVARKESDDKASAAQGGDLGSVAETQMVPAIKAAVQGLGKGEISDPVNAAGGWHLLRLIDTQPAAPRPFELVRDELATALRQQRAQENAAAYLNKLLADQHAAVDEISLQKAMTSGPTAERN